MFVFSPSETFVYHLWYPFPQNHQNTLYHLVLQKEAFCQECRRYPCVFFKKMILSLYTLICIVLIVSYQLKDFASFPALPFYISLISFPIPLSSHPCRVIKPLNFRCVKKNKLISLIRMSRPACPPRSSVQLPRQLIN